jgi:hypothetical protein
MKKLLPIVTAAFMTVALASARAESKTLHYPEQDKSMFTIATPDDWKVTEIEEVGDFGSLESENGSILQFRAIECENEEDAKAEIDSISESTVKFLEENYTDIELGDVAESEMQGAAAFEVSGTAKDKEGDDVAILTCTVVLGKTTIGEVWAAVYPEDIAAAKATLASFTPAAAVAAE